MASQLYSPPLINEEIIFIDGLSRAGKFLLGKLVSNFQRVEYFQYQHICEHLAFMNFMGIIPSESAQSYLRMSVNMYLYEMAIGRNLNERNESSSVKNSTEYAEYMLRKNLPDGPKAIDRFIEMKRISSFLVHECLPHVDFFQGAIPNFKMINIQRHPIDLAASWYLRGWGERWGKDPLAVIPVKNYDNHPCPWFTKNWEDEWIALEKKPYDRVAKAIVTITNYENEGYEKFLNKEKILKICYEHLFSNPHNCIKSIQSFVKTEPFSNMDEILKREGCPANDLEIKRIANFKIMKKNVSPKYLSAIVDQAKRYEEKWGLATINY